MPVQPKVDVIPSNSTLRLAHGRLELKNHQATLDARFDQLRRVNATAARLDALIGDVLPTPACCARKSCCNGSSSTAMTALSAGAAPRRGGCRS